MAREMLFIQQLHPASALHLFERLRDIYFAIFVDLVFMESGWELQRISFVDCFLVPFDLKAENG